MGRPRANPNQTQTQASDPVLDLVVIESTRRAGRLTLRLVGELHDGGAVMDSLDVVGFRAGDRVELRRRRR